MAANVRQFFGCELYVRTTYVLLDTLNALGPRNGDYPRSLRQQPAEGDTGRGSLFLLGKFFYILHQLHVVLQVLALKAWNSGAEICLVKLRVLVESPGQHRFAQRTERYEADAQFFQRG